MALLSITCNRIVLSLSYLQITSLLSLRWLKQRAEELPQETSVVCEQTCETFAKKSVQ